MNFLSQTDQLLMLPIFTCKLINTLEFQRKKVSIVLSDNCNAIPVKGAWSSLKRQTIS